MRSCLAFEPSLHRNTAQYGIGSVCKCLQRDPKVDSQVFEAADAKGRTQLGGGDGSSSGVAVPVSIRVEGNLEASNGNDIFRAGHTL